MSRFEPLPLLAAFAVITLLALTAPTLPPAAAGRAAAAATGAGDAPQGVPSGAVDPEALERARAAGKALAGELMKTLGRELTRSGPAEAVEVCSEVAQDIAASHSTGGLTVRRVSRKVRNPADRPDAWEREQLERLARLHARGELPEEVAVVRSRDASRTLRYLKPIVLGEMCLTCHGNPEQIPAEVQEILKERYPHDEAVGYEAGELRGAVSVQVELPAEPAGASSATGAD